MGMETDTTMAQTVKRPHNKTSWTCAIAGAFMTTLALAALGFAPAVNAQVNDARDAKPAAKSAPAAAASSADGGLKSRVESLEEQLVDMQVVVGTLESLAKSGGAAQPSFKSGGGNGDSIRVDGLESQVRQLSSQVQQLSDQVRSLGGTPRRSDIPSSTQSTAEAAALPSPQGDGGFGATTVTENSDAIGGLIGGDRQTTFGGQSPPPLAPGANPPGVATAALPPANDGVEPKQLYETAYGFLLQRDYGAAETAFSDFLTRFPSDSLSGNAQYWLGESHFVRGQYKAAAASFLKGYQTYAQSPKAADSLLKLAMSLDRLGQKDAACSSYAELSSKFPNAAQSVKTRAQSERQRVGCS